MNIGSRLGLSAILTLLLAIGGCESRSTPPANLPAAPAQNSASNEPNNETSSDATPPSATETEAERDGAAPKSGGAVQVASDLPEYKPTDGVSGTIKVVGSDSMLNVMTYWCDDFSKLYPNVQPEVEGKGSGTAPPALTAGTANFGPMSRPMKAKELDEFEAKFGYKPIALKTSIDMLAVYVHKDNPIKGLTFQQLDAIFSKNRKGGHPKEIRTWGDLGLTGEWANKSISLYGRNSASGTYGYFKEHALYGGDYKDSVIEQPGSSAVVQAVARDKGGMGYSGIGYLTADVRAVPLASEEGDDFVPAEPDNAYSGVYPLSRYLFVYLNYKPGSELDPLRREFIKYIFSQEGQQDVVKDGYLPVNLDTAVDALGSVGISTGQ